MHPKLFKTSSKDSLTEDEVRKLNDAELDKHSKSAWIELLYSTPIWMVWFLYKCLNIAIKTSGVYMLWICLHYVSAHLYVKLCVPNTVVGFVMSPFMISTPHCQGLRWVVYNAANIVNNMWMVIGAWIYSLIWMTNVTNDDA